MTDRLTDEEIEEIRRRVKYATQGDLRSAVNIYSNKLSLYDENDQKVAGDLSRSDAKMFYHARTDIPRLLDEVERLREFAQRVLHDLDDVTGEPGSKTEMVAESLQIRAVELGADIGGNHE